MSNIIDVNNTTGSNTITILLANGNTTFQQQMDNSSHHHTHQLQQIQPNNMNTLMNNSGYILQTNQIQQHQQLQQHNQPHQHHIQQQPQNNQQTVSNFDFDFLNINDNMNLDKNLLNLNMLDFQTTVQPNQQHQHHNDNTFNQINSTVTSDISDDFSWYHQLNQSSQNDQQYQFTQLGQSQQMHQNMQLQPQQQQHIIQQSQHMVHMMPPPIQQQQILSSPSINPPITPNKKSNKSTKSPNNKPSSTGTVRKIAKPRKNQRSSANTTPTESPNNSFNSATTSSSNEHHIKNLTITNHIQAIQPHSPSLPSSSYMASASSHQQQNISQLILSVQHQQSNQASPTTMLDSPTATLLLLSPPPSANSASSSSSASSSNTNLSAGADSSKPLTGYQHYFKIRQQELRSQDQTLKFGDIVKIVGNEWSKNIDKETKEKFINRGLQDKERYKIEQCNENSSQKIKMKNIQQQQNQGIKHEPSTKMDYTQDLNFTLQSKNENLNSMQVLRIKELERQHQNSHSQQQIQLMTQQQHHNTILSSDHHHNHPSPKKLSKIDKPSDLNKQATHTSDCCLLAHSDYFDISAYHSKIIERSCQSGNELKTMKLKQSAIKLDNRKSNQVLKQLKNEIDKKQTYLTEINKNIAASNEQFNKFKDLIKLCNDAFVQQAPQQAIYLGSVGTAVSAIDENFNQNYVQDNQLVQPSMSGTRSNIATTEGSGNPGTVYFINQSGNHSDNVQQQQQASSQEQMQYQQQVHNQVQQQHNVIYIQQQQNHPNIQFQLQQQPQQPSQYTNYINHSQPQPVQYQQQQSQIFLQPVDQYNSYVQNGHQQQPKISQSRQFNFNDNQGPILIPTDIVSSSTKPSISMEQCSTSAMASSSSACSNNSS